MKKSVFLKLVTLFLVLPICVQLSLNATPTATQYGVVLNLSGKQRMLTQKMSKEIMLINLDVDKASNLGNLKKTSSLFNKTLKGLRDGDGDLKLPATSEKRILRQLKKIDGIWVEFNKVVQAILSSGSVSKEQIEVIAKMNLPLLKQMNKCVRLYEKDASKSGLKASPGLAVTINLSGKQRMLTQKMSKEFLLVASGHDVENNRLSLSETFSLFERTLKGLEVGDSVLDLPGTKSADIVKQLKVVGGLWKVFKPIVEAGAGSAKITPSQIKELAQKNLPLLREMNKAVKMYEIEASK